MEQVNSEQRTVNNGAADVVDAEFTEETGLERRNAQISIRHEMSPDSLRTEIARQTEMQEIMVKYVRDHMVKEHHYYSFNEGGKPALTKDGAHRICSLFKVIPGPVDIEVIREDGGHFTVVSHAHLFNQDGIEIASSRGSASTRESKYAYRWVWHDKMPADVDKSTLKTKGTGAKLQYQLPNPDLADLENTIIKMSEKRATVGAVNKLPLVSELFATDPADVAPAAKGTSKPAHRTPADKPASQQSSPVAGQAPSQEVTSGKVEVAVNLAAKLQKDHGVDFESLSMQFLPEGVGKFSELTEEQAAGVVPGLAELLTAKVSGRSEK